MRSSEIRLTTILIHPSPLFSEGLRRILAGTPFHLASFAPAIDLIPERSVSSKRSLLFVIGGRDTAESAQDVRVLLGRHARARIVVIGGSERGDVMSVLEAGASGYLHESISCAALVKALELIMDDEIVMPAQCIKRSLREVAVANDSTAPWVAERRLNGPARPCQMLSAREAAILHYLAQGASNKVIARKLEITEATVKVHMKSILRKTLVKNRTQAAIWAVRHHLDFQIPDAADGSALDSVTIRRQ
jgi:two-component system, NarL family, nitrate/nitrite response regulator NarL